MKLLHLRVPRATTAGPEFDLRVSCAALLVAPLALACAASFPAPTQRLIDAQSAERSAQELGATEEPKAQHSLQRAQDQIAAAEAAMADGENRKADALLIRARADAELAVAQTRETDARLSLKDAKDDSTQQTTLNKQQGAVQ